MLSVDRIVIVLILLWIAVYTASYGVWTYKNKNKLGGIVVLILALVALALPILTGF